MASNTHVSPSTPSLESGLLNLTTLAINGTNLPEIDVGEIKQATKYQTLILDRILKGPVFQNAARNLIGVTLYRSDRKEDAIEKWKETLTIDELNLNALQDLCTAYEEMGDAAELAKYKRLRQRAQKRDTCGIGLSEREARCKIEKAYAIFYDIPTNESEAKARSHVQLLKNVCTLVNDFVSSLEDQYCELNAIYFLALAYHNYSTELSFMKRQPRSESEYPEIDEKHKEAVDKSISSLKISQELSQNLQHVKLSAQILCKLGDIYTHNPSAEQNVDQYYRGALEEDPDDRVWLYARRGESCRVRGDLDNAFDYCTLSIRIAEGLPPDDPTRESRRCAYGFRGKVRRDQASQIRDRQGKRDKLEQALEDLETAYQIHPNRKLGKNIDSVRKKRDRLG